jgi:biotin synthase
LKYIGNKVFFRGIIEFSNICAKDCFYCGIRKGNKGLKRFRLEEENIIKLALWAHEHRYGSIVLQGGELETPDNASFIENVLYKIKAATNNELGITLSLGEQTSEVYERWFKAGAHRYLLRIESSNPALYKTMHPENHDFERRLECIKLLKKTGYQTGTGVLIGLPGQTTNDLVNDLLFFKEMDVDMLGMGPYLVHHETPLGKSIKDFDPERQLKLGLKMIAAARVFLKDINIASTTALQALHGEGRELGLKAGGNVIMPNLTDTEFRPDYKLYDNKPGTDENAESSRISLQEQIEKLGETVAYGEWGDSKHFFKRTGEK